MYDNTVSARTYLSYIAEQAGGIAVIGRDGKLYIKTIGESSATLPLKLFKTFKWGEKFKITRVRYDDGTQLFEKGDTTGNTVYISQDNMYIVDQEQINNIYNALKDLEFYSFEGESIIDPALDTGDIVVIDGKNVIYQGSMQFSGRWIASIESKIQCKAKEETTRRTPSQKTINRRVESNINQIDGKITKLTEETTENSQKITQQEQDIDSLKNKVSNIQDLTRIIVNNRTVTLENCAKGDLLSLRIKGNNTVFKYLYPSDDLYPSDNLLPIGDSRISVTDKDNNETVYELGITDVLRQNGEVYDEFVLENGQAKVIRRINDDGSIKTTDELYFSDDLYMGDTLYLKGNKEEEIEDLGELKITLNEGTNTIKILNYSAEITAKYAIKNDYTDIFATKVEMNSSIEQTAEKIESNVSKTYQTLEGAKTQYSNIKQTTDEITTLVGKKVGENEIISKINQSAEAISIKADKINLNGAVTANENFKIKSDGSMEAKNGTFTGGNISLSGGTNQNNAKFIIEDPTNNQKFAYITPNSIQAGDSSGNDGYFSFNEGVLNVGKGNNGSYLQLTQRDDGTRGKFYMSVTDAYVTQGSIHALEYHYDSLAEKKKNIKLYEKNAIDIIKNTDVYEFNYKSQEDNYKKNIGFVIGDNYRTSKEIFTNDKVGINSYSVLGVLWKAVQEQQNQIELLQEEINKLKGEQ